MVNSFNLTLSGKHFICPSILNEALLDRVVLDVGPCLSGLQILQPLLAFKVSFEKSADSLMGTMGTPL